MADLAETEARLPGRTAQLLGGRQVLGHEVTSALDAHEIIVGGLPNEALQHLIAGLLLLDPRTSVEKGVGASYRTFERGKSKPHELLSAGLGGRTWKFAEILARATTVLGTRAEAERWLDSPAMALEQRRPIDLLASPVGVELVEDLLGRIEYGVYT